MDEGRVAACHRLENRRRKFLIVINDVVKSKNEVYSEYVDHAHKTRANQLEKSKMFVKRALVRQKILQQCMQMRRANVDPRNLYGRYGGKPIEAFGRDIEHFIAYNHPKARRKRYLQELMSESFEKGAILKQRIADQRVSRWMERSYTKFRLQQAKKEKEKEKSVLATIDESDKKTSGKKSERVKEKLTVDDNINEITDNVNKMAISDQDHKDAEEKAPLAPRRALKLPPIKPTRAMVAT